MKAIIILLLPLALAACQQRMEHMPRNDTYSASPILPNGMAAQRPPEGTVAREDDIAPQPTQLPEHISLATLERGQARYDIFCSPCHSVVGDGDGMIVRRGFPRPPTYHQPALRAASDRHLYDVITNGYGAMYPYRDRIPPADRWAIVAYVRALQLSQHAALSDLPEDARARVEATP